MASVLHHKFVAALPAVLEANSIYFVRVGTGFDQYITNSSGTIVAYPINREPLIVAGSASQYWRGDKSWQDLPTAVRAAALTGLSVATSSTVVAADTVLVGVGKLQAQVTSLSTSVSGKEPAISAGTTAQYWRGDKGWQDLNASVRAAVLTGLSTATAAALVATDSVLVAFGKLQAQLNNKLDASGTAASASKLSPGASINGVPFDGTGNITVADSTKEPTVSAGTTSQYWRGDKAWRDLATDVRVSALTGLSVATSTAITATDTVIAGLGKLQAQITSLTSVAGGKEPAISAGTVGQFWRGTKVWADVVGIVADTGGVPSGAIIETGSNANGTFTKFADGLLLCRTSINIGPWAAGGAATAVWTYPAAFVSGSNPQVVPNLQTGSPQVFSASVQSKTSSAVTLAAGGSAGASGTVECIAMGRWKA